MRSEKRNTEKHCSKVPDPYGVELCSKALDATIPQRRRWGTASFPRREEGFFERRFRSEEKPTRDGNEGASDGLVFH